MSETNKGWSNTLFWGGISGLCYAAIFSYADYFIYLAHTTVDTCVVTVGDKTEYFRKPEATQCSAKGGKIIPGNVWHLIAPIMVAGVISYAHGLFTGHFWESVGLTAAKQK